jgi:hypothetical protein
MAPREQRRKLVALAAVPLLAAGCDVERTAVTVPWLRAEPVSGGRVLKIGYESDPCTRARKARVEEKKGAVTVTLLDPERDPERACILLAKTGCVAVRLAEPLGDRPVRDGAPNPFPQSKRGAEKLPFGRFGRCRPVPVER